MENNEKEQEQPTLFGDQDFVYNALNNHVLGINNEIERLLKSKDRIDEKVKKLKHQKTIDETALSIMAKEIKKLRPEEEPGEEAIEPEVVEENETTEETVDETSDEISEEEESEDPFE